MRCSVFDSDSDTPSSTKAPLWLFVFFLGAKERFVQAKEVGWFLRGDIHAGNASDSKQSSIYMSDIFSGCSQVSPAAVMEDRRIQDSCSTRRSCHG